MARKAIDNKNKLDQFYTNEDVSKMCISKLVSIVPIQGHIMLEPSAGTGSFYKQLPDPKIGVDIEPGYPGVIKQDFLSFTPDENKKYIVVGNPPFGINNSMSVKFFNKAAEFADVIAFIIPRIFKRVSIHNRVSLDFHLEYSEDLPMKPCCFTPKMNAKCCFQIWKRKDVMREKVKLPTKHADWDFLSNSDRQVVPTGVDFAMVAYGANSGRILSPTDLKPPSLHFIKSNIDIATLKDRFDRLDYSISRDTTRQDSIGRAELVWLYSQNSWDY